MKLSEAIRIGAKRRPQNTDGGYFRTDTKGIRRSCALGAAGEAATGEDRMQYYYDLFPELRTKDICPLKTCDYGTAEEMPCDLADIVIHLNDDHKQTRQKIADYVEALGY